MRRLGVGLLFVLVLAALPPGCGDDVRGRLKILVAPLHEGRNPTQDPFALVDRVEIGLTDEAGSYRALGSGAPLARFGPGLVAPGGVASPTLRGVNERGRPVSLGFGPVIDFSAGLDTVVSIPFARVDHAVARRLRAFDRSRPDPFARMPPALRLDASHLEQGSVDSASDAGCLVWFLWEGDQLLVRARVFDESVGAASDGQALDSGDSLTFLIDGAADGLDGGSDDRRFTIAADGRIDVADHVEDLRVEALADGYEIRFETPLAVASKNAQLGLDLRLVDVDGNSEPTYLTWVFDPRNEGAMPSADQFGRLVLAVPLLDLFDGGGTASFDRTEGPVRLGGRFSPEMLHLEVEVEDDQVLAAGTGGGVEGADRVEIWLDLANDRPSGEALRFCRFAITAGGVHEPACGPDRSNVTGAGFAFSGSVQATMDQGGYAITLNLPFADLQLPGPPQRGWFLGADLVVIDEDDGGQTTSSWSGDPERVDRWSELRLFSAE